MSFRVATFGIGLVVLVSLATLPTAARADHIFGIGGGEPERALRPGAYVPYDGAGRMHRVNYDLGSPAFYWGYSGHRLAYMDYLDRLDRQYYFGHTWHSRKYGCAYQVMRIENEYWSKWAMWCPW